MSIRRAPKYATKDARAGPWTVCDTCGFIWSQGAMQFQYDYDGTAVAVSQGVLRCPKCITPLTMQRKLLVIPPDPPMYFNTRPGQQAVDETNWLYDFSDNRVNDLDTPASPITTDIPNSIDSGMICELAALIRLPGGSLTVAYLDLFNGNPAGAPTLFRSVLAEITGSATRTNIFSQLTLGAGATYNNTLPITLTSNIAVNSVNVSHAAFFDAPTGGTRLMSGTVSASPTLQKNFAARFKGGAFIVMLT